MIALELLSEPAIVPDVYVSGLAHIEDVGDGNLRFTFFTKQRSVYGGEDWIVVAKLVMPQSAVHMALKHTMKALGFTCCGAGKMAGRH